MRNTEDLRNQTISWGTLNPIGYVPKFLAVLKEFAPEVYRRVTRDNPELLDVEGHIDDRDISFAIEDLFNAMDEIAPEGCTFRSLEGDGTDFGYWEEELEFAESRRPRGRILKESNKDVIPSWTRNPTSQDMAIVQDAVNTAIEESGLKANVSFKYDRVNKADAVHFWSYATGYGGIQATIKIEGVPEAFRIGNGSIIRDFDTITIKFARIAYVRDVETSDEFHEKMRGFISDSPDKAMELADELDWDGELWQYNASFNGARKEYRARHWSGAYIYLEDTFSFADDAEELKQKIIKLLRNVARALPDSCKYEFAESRRPRGRMIRESRMRRLRRRR